MQLVAILSVAASVAAEDCGCAGLREQASAFASALAELQRTVTELSVGAKQQELTPGAPTPTARRLAVSTPTGTDSATLKLGESLIVSESDAVYIKAGSGGYEASLSSAGLQVNSLNVGVGEARMGSGVGLKFDTMGPLISVDPPTWGDSATTTVLSSAWDSSMGDYVQLTTPSNAGDTGHLTLTGGGYVGIGSSFSAAPESQLELRGHEGVSLGAKHAGFGLKWNGAAGSYYGLVALDPVARVNNRGFIGFEGRASAAAGTRDIVFATSDEDQGDVAPTEKLRIEAAGWVKSTTSIVAAGSFFSHVSQAAPVCIDPGASHVFDDFVFGSRGSYLITVWNVNAPGYVGGGEYGSTVYLANVGGYMFTISELGGGYISHFQSTSSPTVGLSAWNTNWQHYLTITNVDSRAKCWKYKVLKLDG